MQTSFHSLLNIMQIDFGYSSDNNELRKYNKLLAVQSYRLFWK